MITKIIESRELLLDGVSPIITIDDDGLCKVTVGDKRMELKLPLELLDDEKFPLLDYLRRGWNTVWAVE